MGAGIALQIKRAYPQAALIDVQTRTGDRSKLGTINYVDITIPGKQPFKVINAYTQYYYGMQNGAPVDYDAIRKAFQAVAKLLTPGSTIGIPKIGCGLAGGNWSIVAKIVEEELHNFRVTLVIFE